MPENKNYNFHQFKHKIHLLRCMYYEPHLKEIISAIINNREIVIKNAGKSDG